MGQLINSYRFAGGGGGPAGPTRFYLESSGTPGATPAVDAGWDKIPGSFTRAPMGTTKAGTTLGTHATSSGGFTTSEVGNQVSWQFVSAPLSGAQTITGTVKGIVRVAESNLDANFRAQMVIRVVSGDGSTVRGTLLAVDNTSGLVSEFAASHVNRKWPVAWTGSGAALSSVAASSGDRIVVEIGARKEGGTGGSRWFTPAYGSSSGTDNAEDETSTALNNPWVEFSQGLAF